MSETDPAACCFPPAKSRTRSDGPSVVRGRPPARQRCTRRLFRRAAGPRPVGSDGGSAGPRWWRQLRSAWQVLRWWNATPRSFRETVRSGPSIKLPQTPAGAFSRSPSGCESRKSRMIGSLSPRWLYLRVKMPHQGSREPMHCLSYLPLRLRKRMLPRH